jgi:zinc protease
MTSISPSVLPVLDPATVHRAVLSNGLTVIVRRDTSAPVVAINTYVKAGYFDETDDVVGIAHVLEHMFFKGTDRRGVGEISKQTKAAGGYLNAHTIYDHTSYYTVLPASSFRAGLEIQFDAYANSMIAADELAKELEVIIQEAKRKADNPSAVATETLFEVLHDKHRMRRWRIGREAGLRRLDRDAMVHFYRNFYRPGTTILSIVGDLDPDDVMRDVGGLYGRLPAGEPVRYPGPNEDESVGFRYRELSGDVAQAQLAMGWRTPSTLHPDTPALELAAAVLGAGRASRLYRSVRERQLASSISAYNYTPTELGVFVVHAEAQSDTVSDAARGAWHQIRAIRDEGVDLHELERARRLLESRWIRRLETMEGQASHLAEWESLGDWTLSDQFLERLLTTTPEQVADAVRKYLTPNRAGVVIYRPASAPPVAADAKQMFALLAEPKPAPLLSSPPRAAFAGPATLGMPSLEIEEGGARVYRTPGGVPIMVKRKPGALVAHLGVYALGGARDESAERSGITTLLSRTALKGTTRRTATQIAEDAELLGGSVGSTVASEYFGWSISVPTKNASAALELLADVVQNATIPEDALETERSVALSDVATLRDDMFRYPLRLAMAAAFGDHPYGRSALGSEMSLPTISAADVREWHRSHTLNAPTVIVLVGDFDGAEAAADVSRHFTRLRMAEPSRVDARGR